MRCSCLVSQGHAKGKSLLSILSGDRDQKRRQPRNLAVLILILALDVRGSLGLSMTRSLIKIYKNGPTTSEFHPLVAAKVEAGCCVAF